MGDSQEASHIGVIYATDSSALAIDSAAEYEEDEGFTYVIEVLRDYIIARHADSGHRADERRDSDGGWINNDVSADRWAMMTYDARQDKHAIAKEIVNVWKEIKDHHGDESKPVHVYVV